MWYPLDPGSVTRFAVRLAVLGALALASVACADSAQDPFAVLAEAAANDAAYARAEEAADLAAAMTALHERFAMLDALALPGELVGPVLGEGRDHLRVAGEHAAAGRPDAAWRAVRAAADVVPAAGAGAIALRLIRAGEQRLAETRAAGGRGRDLDRADGLLRAAREAAEDGDHALAIRRAYYARQLLRNHP
jgi:hypothetical protein